MNKIKLYYFKHTPNLGDMLSAQIIEKLFGKTVVYSPHDSCDLIAIGSILQEFICNKRDRNLDYLFDKYFSPELKVWGSGFFEPEGDEKEYFIRKVRFFALRGKLSLERVKKILKNGDKLDGIVLGDPGLLSSFLIGGEFKKKYSLGVIPHFHDRNNPLLVDIINRIKHSVLIDVRNSPLDTVRMISECEIVISSAMHGLIVADSLGIPNMRIKTFNDVTDRLSGGDFKYRDYYSVYGFDMPEPMDLKTDAFTEDDLSYINDSYKIKKENVAIIKKKLVDVFPLKGQ